jgi:hypothetical protein
MSQVPSVGRIVFVTMPPESNNGADVAPAVITRVWGDDVINVRVLPDGRSGESPAITSIRLHADRGDLDRAAQEQRDAALPHAMPVTYRGAYWPPRV